MTSISKDRSYLIKFAWLSIAAAILTIALKAIAFKVTDSVSLLSDALESLVNLAGALMALAMLTIAARPADDEHAFGHSKAEYFSSGFEGTLILVAAVSIAISAIQRMITPKPLEDIALGLGVSIVASLVNLGVARVLLKAGKRHHSITLEANAHHLLTDVWTSAGVLIGIAIVSFTGWERLDPIVALIVAGNIVWSGVRIVRMSILGLMDTAIPADELKTVEEILDSYLENGVQYHALRTRQSGARRFVSFHVLVPGDWTIEHGHHLLESMEANIRKAINDTTVFTHIEPLSDPASWTDMTLDQTENEMEL